MIIPFILFQHPGNILSRKAHIHIKISGNIPWAVLFVLLVRTNSSSDIADIIYSREDH